jgi:hypothetical protein
MTASAYPLAWPASFPRTPDGRREKGRFQTTLSSALNNVRTSLERFGKDSGKSVQHIVMSSNYTLGVENPKDPGVAVYFLWDGLQVCIPVDRYTRIEGNLQAIHLIIEARRTEIRHGTLALVRATFAGFAALPAPDAEDWRKVLGLGTGVCSGVDIQNAYRKLANERHPDKPGGSHEAMAALNRARDAALREVE